MSIVIDTPLVHKSIATLLASIDPSAYIYDNPNQQATKLPSWFIIHREPVKIEREIGRAWLIYSIDLFYMLEYNTPRLFDDYSQIADALNTSLIYLPIYGQDYKTQVYEREWGLQLDALKYSFTLRFRVSQDAVIDEKMQVIEDLSVYLKNQNEAVVSFANTEHPEFDAEFPKAISVTTGRRIALPVVSGIFEDDTYLWTPLRWTIGEFGELITVNESVETDLEWVSTSKTATITYTNTEHPDFDVTLPEPSVVNVGETIALPSVSGEHIEEPYVWRTTAWDIGSFGEIITVTENITANVLWERSKIAVVKKAYINRDKVNGWISWSDFYLQDFYDEDGNYPIYQDLSKTYKVLGLYQANGMAVEYSDAYVESQESTGYRLGLRVKGMVGHLLAYFEYEEM